MPLDLPSHGEADWDTKLNAALNQLNTADATEATARAAADTALDGRLDTVEATLPLKADLVGGTVPDAQLPAALARDTEVTAAVASEATARGLAITAAIDALVAGAPGALNTLNEIATQLATDESAAAALTTAVAGKQPLDADLTTIAGLDSATAGVIVSDGGGWLRKSVTQMRTWLGLGTAALSETTDFDAAGAATSAQAYAVQRTNHTGTQPASTISDFSTAALSATTAAYRPFAQADSVVVNTMDSNGNPTKVTETFGSNVVVTDVTYNADSTPATAKVTINGVVGSTKTFSYSGGYLTGVA